MKHEPSFFVAVESKLLAIGDMQPRISEMQLAGELASAAKFDARLSIQPSIRRMQVEDTVASES